MQDIYKGDGLDIGKILKDIKTVETDNDWDGISSAAQVKFHFPKVKVNITVRKIVESDTNTLVLDKMTSGEGWTIDHHTTNAHEKARLLCFSKSGEIPTGRLTYLTLDKRLDADLFLSATTEITDELYRKGLDSGSLYELHKRFPYYFKHTTIPNQFLKDGEIYSMADILDIVASYDTDYAFKLALRFYKKLPKDSEELIGMLNLHNKKLIESYRKFIEEFDFGYFETIGVAGREILMLDSEKIGKFHIPILGIARRKKPGTYILFKGIRASLRTSDLELAEIVFKKLHSILVSKGGRAGSYGMLLKDGITYEQFKKLLTSK
jgi:hypothetical protein